MWFLLIVLLAAVPGVSRVTVLNTFSTYEACQPERNRVGFEMAESYPGENDFLIVCEFREKTPRVPVREVLSQGRTVQKEWEAHILADADKGTTRQDFRTPATIRTQSIVPSPTGGPLGITGYGPRHVGHPTFHRPHTPLASPQKPRRNGF